MIHLLNHMQLALAERSVTLSVGEFAAFRVGTAAQRTYREGIWRAQLGTVWHEQMRQQTADNLPDARFEVAIEAVYQHRGWTFKLRGRIDQLIETKEGLLLREVKTTSRPIPIDEAELRKYYPHYFNQIATYLALARLQPEFKEQTLLGELLLVDITHGITQKVRIEPNDFRRFETQLDAYILFLEECWQNKLRIQSLDFKPAFPTPRPGQVEAQQALESAIDQTRYVLFEAPTGFGKTGTVLEVALGQLRSGRYQRIIYLTGKSTGQLQAIRQLKAMITTQGALHYFQLRNKREHTEICRVTGCDAQRSCAASLSCLPIHSITAEQYFDKGTLSLDKIGSLAAELQICPYELSRRLLETAEVWLCDYNYIFSPENNSVLFNQLGFSPEQTLLIIDEAHNLPTRVNDCYSFLETYEEANSVEHELYAQRLPSAFRLAWSDWVAFLEAINPSDAFDLNFTYELLDKVSDLTHVLQQTPIDYDQLSPFAVDKLYAPLRMRTLLENDSLEKLLWSSKLGQLRITCLDAAHETAKTLSLFKNVCCMSATLSPNDPFQTSIGITAESTTIVKAPAPWRDQAYRTAIDTRVDTRMKHRGDHYSTTAHTILQLTDHSTAPVLVFFPSYRYAETLKTWIQALNPYTTIAIQPRSVDLNGQMRFIEESLLDAHLLFFVLGSGFSESIDSLGGKIEYTMVVGPALPEVNPVQHARLKSYAHLGPNAAFLHTYQIPAMHKIHQALGRLVRAPGQTARVLLHCRRFAEPSYNSLLQPEYQHSTIIRDTATLQAWLEDL